MSVTMPNDYEGARPAAFTLRGALQSIYVAATLDDFRERLDRLALEGRRTQALAADSLTVLNQCRALVNELIRHVEALQEAGHTDYSDSRSPDIDLHPLAQDIHPRLRELRRLLVNEGV